MIAKLKWIPVVSLVIYILLLIFPRNIGKEKQYILKTKFNISEDNISNIRIDGYYNTEKNSGYYNDKTGIIKNIAKKTDEEILINSYGYLKYEKTGKIIYGFSQSDVILFELQSSGYPYITDDSPFFYVIKSNGMGITYYNFKGHQMFPSKDYTSIITGVSTDINRNTFVTTFSGEAYLYDIKGNVIFDISIGKIESPIFLKNGIVDRNGHLAATMTGIEQEKINVYDIKSRTLINTFNNVSVNRYAGFIYINDGIVYYENGSKISSINIQNKNRFDYPFAGNLNSVIVSDNNELLISSSIDGLTHIKLVSKNGVDLFYRCFIGSVSSINYRKTEKITLLVNDSLLQYHREQL